MTIDYREAFVIDMEIAAHSWECKECAVAALKGDQEKFCMKMKHMRSVIDQAYKALPSYYKERYERALTTTTNKAQEAFRDVGIHS